MNLFRKIAQRVGAFLGLGETRENQQRYEQRVQAYLSLIQELFACPSEEEPQILNGHMELVDEGFVQVCELVAVQLQEAGREGDAEFLRNVAQNVRTVLADEDVSEGAEIDPDYLPFLMELLQAENESDGNPQDVYRLLAEYQDKLDLTLAASLVQWFHSELDTKVNNSKRNHSLAGLLNSIAIDIHQFPLGSRADNIEISILCYQAALEVYTRTAFPEDWAATQNNLGNAYLFRIKEDRAKNLERAIACYEAALEVYTPTNFIYEWAGTQNNLGNTYLIRIWGERGENIEQAIAYYNSALDLYSNTSFIEDWATTQNNLGNAYLFRIREERAENIEFAISAYKSALTVFSYRKFKEVWAEIQSNLGNAYSKRIRGEKAQNIEIAIKLYKASLKVRTRIKFPKQWSDTQNNLGTAYAERIRGNRLRNIEQAIACYEASLDVCTFTDFPEEWAGNQNGLGNAYSKRIRGNRFDNIEQAIVYYKAALEIFTYNDFPEKWAIIQNNLGNAYSDRIREERSENLETAITYYQSALKVRNYTNFPEDWAETQNGLGTAYFYRIEEKRVENIKRAIAHYEAALKVYTRTGFPDDWAMIQGNLGNAYCNRIDDERPENLEISIAYYEAALEVYTRTAYPYEWATTQNNLANAYKDRILEDSSENLEKAIDCYKAALKVRTFNRFSEEWAETQNNLGNAYGDRILGNRVQNIERAIGCYKAALKVYTNNAFPYEWAITQNNLGNAYGERIRGKQKDNLQRSIACCKAALKVCTRAAFPEQWATIQNNLGTIYEEQGEAETAIASYKAALEVFTPSTFPLNCLGTGRNLGNLGYALQNWEIAIEGYNQAILAIEQSRYWATSEATKRELIANSLDIYQKMVQACINHQDYAQALLTVERSKSRTLLELLDSAHLYPKNATDAQKQRISDLRRQIASYQQQLAYTSRDTLTPTTEKHPNQPSPETLIRQELQAANQQFQDLLTELDDPNFTLTQQVPAQLPDLRRLLPPQTALMEWYLPTEAESGFYAFLVTRRDEQIQITPHHFSAEDRQHLDEALQDYRSDYGEDTWNEQLPQRLETLSGALQLPRLLAELSEIQHLILIPHRELHLIPLHALPVSSSPLSRSGRGAGGEGKPLQDCFPVQYAPSCQILNNLQQRPPLNRETVPFFAIQNPTEDLDYAEWGVELLLRQFSPHQVLRRDQATRANLTEPHTQTFLEQSHAVHFGCHGEFDDRNPLNAYVRLANGEKLTFLDIFNDMNIPLCRLLVLSACKTGLVETSHTDDYVGLSSAFFYAGARTVVASLWNVDELAATLVTLRLYQILPDYPSVTVALQAAQTWLRGLSSADVLDWLKHEQKATEEEVEEVEDRLSLFDDDPPFANAYYWSAFTAAGL